MEQKSLGIEVQPPEPPSWPLQSAARGLALFFGAFSLANGLVAAIARRSEDVWWIDFGMMSSWFGAITGLLAAILLLMFGVVPRMTDNRRFLTCAACVTLSSVALSNVLSYYLAWVSGSIRPEVPVPFSAILAATFAWLCVVAWRSRDVSPHRWARALTIGVALTAVILFPLLQVGFFGTTDYRRPAAMAVVFGAKVHPDGTLSSSLADRVRTGVELYRQGLTERLVMSGGVGASGVDEALAMRDFAVAMGVPADAITVDSMGVNTDATVRNTCDLLGEGERMMVVSQFYHLPRIKLAYRAAGCDVLTVPADEMRPIPKTPMFVLREIPGFWVYWGRSVWRDISPR